MTTLREVKVRGTTFRLWEVSEEHRRPQIPDTKWLVAVPYDGQAIGSIDPELADFRPYRDIGDPIPRETMEDIVAFMAGETP